MRNGSGNYFKLNELLLFRPFRGRLDRFVRAVVNRREDSRLAANGRFAPHHHLEIKDSINSEMFCSHIFGPHRLTMTIKGLETFNCLNEYATTINKLQQERFLGYVCELIKPDRKRSYSVARNPKWMLAVCLPADH